MSDLNADLVEALDRVLTNLLNTPRRVSPVEARKEVNQAYIRLIAACGFGRLGAIDRARVEAGIAAGVLEPFRNDAIHGLFIDAFNDRIDNACAGGSRFAPIPKPQHERRAKHDRVSSYKVARLWEVVRMLDGGIGREETSQSTAVARFSNRLPQFDQHGHEIAPIAETELASTIASQLESSSDLDVAAGIQRISECLGRILELSEESGMPLLVRALELIDARPDRSLEVRVAALEVIAFHGWGELVPHIFHSLVARLAAAPLERLVEPLDRTLHALRRLDLTEELAALLARFDARLSELPSNRTLEAPVPPLALRYLIAGGLTFIGDQRGSTILDQLRDDLRVDAEITLSQRLEWTRAVANGYALAPIPIAIDNLERLFGGYRDVSDSYGTNSHYCLAVLDFSDALVGALAQARIGRGPP